MLNQIAAIHGTGTPAVTNSYESIATVTVGSGGSGSIVFSSIPSTFKHLQLRFLAQSSFSNIKVYFNSDTSTSNYAFHNLRGDGSATSTLAFVSGGANSNLFVNEGMPQTGSNFGGGVIDILDYANTNKYKTSRALAGYDTNGAGYVTLNSSLWMSTAAISNIELTFGTYSQNSKFALYGIKG